MHAVKIPLNNIRTAKTDFNDCVFVYNMKANETKITKKFYFLSVVCFAVMTKLRTRAKFRLLF